MKKTLKIIGLVFITFSLLNQSIAQNPGLAKYDSLIAIAETDTARIKLIQRKLDLMSAINLDSAINLALKTLDEARDAGFYRGEVDLLMNLANNYTYKGNFPEARKKLNNLAQTIKPINDSTDFAMFYSSRGMFYGMQSKYDSSIYFYKKSIRIYERSDNKGRLGTSYANIAIGYQQQSNFPMALLYQQKALRVHEKTNNERSKAYALVNMANTYNNLGDFKRADSVFLETIALAKKLELLNVELYAYSNLASMYTDLENWQKCYDYAMKAADLGRSFGDPAIEAASLSKAATALVNLVQPENAMELSKKAIALADSSLQPLIINQAYSSMGYALLMQKRWKVAIPYYEKSLEVLKGADIYTIDIGVVTKQLSECYEKTGNFSKALELYKQYNAINDSVSRKENIRKATEQMMNYEFDKKMQTARLVQDAKDEIMYTRQVGLIAGLVLSVILILAVLIGYFNKKKANGLLREQKGKVEQTLEQLRNTQAQLVHAEKMASLGELTAGIAHEIQNPLNFVNNFSEVNLELIGEADEELEKGNHNDVKDILKDVKQNQEKINHHGKRADAIVKGMLQHSRTSAGQKEPTDLNALADEYLRLAYHGLRAKDKSFNADFTLEADENLPKINVVPQDIGRVLLNLINNAFFAVSAARTGHVVRTGHALSQQHALATPEKPYKPLVTLTTKNLGHSIEIRVKDNGSGIPENIKNKIFQPFFTTKPAGEGTGLGLSLSYDIITKGHGGKIKVRSGEGEGTEFTIILPI